MCNDGTVEYGRLQCARGEYNKEPNGFPYLLSLVYRVAGVSDAAAFRLNNLVAGLSVLATIILADLLFNDARIAVLSGMEILTSPVVDGSRRIFTGRLYRFPGLTAHRCPSP